MTEENTEQAAQAQTGKLYVGNLPYSTTEEDLTSLFSKVGQVSEGSAMIIRDQGTNRSKGFGFVTMTNPEDAEKAISELNGTEIEGRKIVVAHARPQTERNSGERRFSQGNFN